MHILMTDNIPFINLLLLQYLPKILSTGTVYDNYKNISYTECHRRNGPNFGRVFLMLNYTDITQNTYIQS